MCEGEGVGLMASVPPGAAIRPQYRSPLTNTKPGGLSPKPVCRHGVGVVLSARFPCTDNCVRVDGVSVCVIQMCVCV